MNCTMERQERGPYFRVKKPKPKPKSTRPTKRQLELLRFLYEHQRTTGLPPAIREMVQALGVSATSTIHDLLVRLESKGCIERHPSANRGRVITETGLAALGVESVFTRIKKMRAAGQLSDDVAHYLLTGKVRAA